MRFARRCLILLLWDATRLVGVHAAEPGVTAPRVLRDVPYAVVRSAGKTLPLDLYLPASTNGRPVPVVLWLHGGGWISGDKAADVPVGMFTRAGYALASVNYRYSTQGRFPAQIQDVKAAVRWVRANARALGMDPARIAVCGISSGGHLAALLGTSGGVPELEDLTMGNPDVSSRVQAVASGLARRKGDAADTAWASSLSRQLLDPRDRERLLADRPRSVDVPPGDPIGGESDWMDLP